MKKTKYLWFLLLLIPITVFVVFMIIFINCPKNAKWLELSLSTVGTSATIILGIMVYIQSERHKETADLDRKQDLLIQTTPYISFCKIEFAELSDNNSVLLSEQSSDCLRYCKTPGERKRQYTEEEFWEKYSSGNLFRFIFNCKQDKGLKNIIFRDLTVYPEHINGVSEKSYSFINKTAKLTDDDCYQISYIGNDNYQICKYFMSIVQITV